MDRTYKPKLRTKGVMSAEKWNRERVRAAVRAAMGGEEGGTLARAIRSLRIMAGR